MLEVYRYVLVNLRALGSCSFAYTCVFSVATIIDFLYPFQVSIVIFAIFKAFHKLKFSKSSFSSWTRHMYCLSSSLTWVFFRGDPRASTWLLPPMLLLTVSRSLRAYLLPACTERSFHKFSKSSFLSCSRHSSSLRWMFFPRGPTRVNSVATTLACPCCFEAVKIPCP